MFAYNRPQCRCSLGAGFAKKRFQQVIGAMAPYVAELVVPLDQGILAKPFSNASEGNGLLSMFGSGGKSREV